MVGCATGKRPGYFEAQGVIGDKACTPVDVEKRNGHRPQLDSLSPGLGFDLGGSELRLRGRGFRAGAQVFLGGTPCVDLEYISEASIKCTSSPHARGKVEVVVVNPDLSCDSLANAFQYVPGFQIAPKSVQLNVGDSIQFKAQGASGAVRFSLVDGSGQVDASGLFTAGSVPGAAFVRVVDVGSGAFDTGLIDIKSSTAGLVFQDLTVSASSSQIGVGESVFLAVSGGAGPYRYFLDPQLGTVDAMTGRLTVLKVADDALVQVQDQAGHQAVIHLKFVDRVRLTGLDRIEPNQVSTIQAQGGVPPYVFTIVSGLGQLEPNGQFTAPDRPANTVISVKDSVGNIGQMSVLTVPKLSLSPSLIDVLPGQTVRFLALGGVAPYSFQMAGVGRIDSKTGVYLAPEHGTTDTIEVKDAHGSIAAAKVNVSTTVSSRLIASSLGHTCAVNQGVAECWGENQWGQLGNGSLRRQLRPMPVVGLERHVASVVAGYRHTCALLGNGAVKCWGDNSKGQLGIQSVADPEIQQRGVPQAVAGLGQGVVAIAAGQLHTCAIRDSKVYCWGDNSKGQLGLAGGGWSGLPVQVAQIDAGAQSIAAGAFHSCAIVQGAAKCWGWNINGQLGNSGRIDSEEPVNVFGLSEGVQLIEASGNHTCATTKDGLFCWGYNAAGQLGDRSTSSHSAPVPVLGLEGSVEQLALGSQHTCVRMGGVTQVLCWGYNHFGQVGKPSGGIEKIPQAVSLPGSVTALGAGEGHTCALVGDSYTCWGHNSSGQLGNRTIKDSSAPAGLMKFD